MNDNANTALMPIRRWDNVVKFEKPSPKKLHIPDPPSRELKEETKRELEESENRLVKRLDSLVDEHTTELFDALDAEGISPDPEDYETINDFFFVAEALRSAIYRIHGLYHDIQDVVDEDYTLDPAMLDEANRTINAEPLTKEQLDELMRMTSENPDIPD